MNLSALILMLTVMILVTCVTLYFSGKYLLHHPSQNRIRMRIMMTLSGNFSGFNSLFY